MKNRNVLLVNLYPPKIPLETMQYDASEMYYLVSSLGDANVVEMIHQRGYPAKAAYIGRGKAEEIAEVLEELHIDVVVVNGIAKPRQLYELWKILSAVQKQIIVWDRVDLILQIFAKHAHTAEAKLQIELAHMRHMGPRIYGMGHVLSQQAGGIGTRGIGETNVELMKRHWKDAIRLVKEKLKKLELQRSMQIEKRKEKGLYTISIVGYTNAGKSTLFNALTKKKNFADNMLFATLDSSVGKLYLPHLSQEVLLSDTIGFIKQLPPSLIDAFKSTLLESLHADILLHVIDGSSPNAMDQFRVVEQVLSDLHADEKDEYIVINKMDQMTPQMKETIERALKYADKFYVSAKTGEGCDEIIRVIEQGISELDHHNRQVVRPSVVDSHLPTRDDLTIGQMVEIVQKEDQVSGKTTIGPIAKILSHGYSHPRGIKVALQDGTIGRVKHIV